MMNLTQVEMIDETLTVISKSLEYGIYRHCYSGKNGGTYQRKILPEEFLELRNIIVKHFKDKNGVD